MIEKVRSLLYIPADKQKMINKVPIVFADAIIFDLEDSVCLERKNLARDYLKELPIWREERQKEFIVRINSEESSFFDADMNLVAALCPDAIMLPKACEDSVKRADDLLSAFEAQHAFTKGGVKIIPLIETAYGVCRALEIANSSPRVCALHFGAEDFTRDMGIERTKSGREIDVARALIAMASKACNIAAIDCPYTDFKDDEGLAADCMTAKQFGMNAKACIHPTQIDIVNSSFLPSHSEIEAAKEILAASTRPENIKKGAFQLNGKMIDAPIISRAKLILERLE